MDITDTPCVVTLPTGQLPAASTASGDDGDVSSSQGPQQHLSHDAHRRWKASNSVLLLNKVKSVVIHETRTTEDGVVLFTLHVTVNNSPSIRLERSFSDFKDLRNDIWNAVSAIPPCTCQYCLDLLVYFRFKVGQPRGLVKLTGTETRKKILAQFMNDLVLMGRRRQNVVLLRRQMDRVIKRECQAQSTVPVLIHEFLLD